MDLRLDGKRVLLTAGGAGIGRVTLQTFFDAGARLVTCDVDQAALDKLRGELPEVPAIRADVADEADVDRLFALAQQELGGLDILINNAGIAGPTGPIEAIEPAEWRRCLEVNLTGQYLCARRAVPLHQGRGRRLDRQSVLGGRSLRLRASDPLLRLQMGGGRAHQGARDRGRAGSDPGQRHLPGRGRGRSDQPGDRRQGPRARRRVRGDVPGIY